MKDETKIIVSGRHPERHQGIVNPPIVRASTVMAGSMDEWDARKKIRATDVPGMYYGRHGTPTTQSLEEAVAELDGAYRAHVYPSGLAACVTAILSTVGSGDHLLITDSAYEPVRRFTQGYLARMGVTATFYDPRIGAGIAELIRPQTRAIYLESPGSHTMEVQDIPAIVDVARRHGIKTIVDNTWATPLYFKPIAHGVDLAVQAATKYIVGHSDAMLGLVSANRESWPALRDVTHDLGQIAGPDDAYLGHRGLRTMHVRLQRHWENGMRLAEWLQARPEVERVIHPGLPGDAGHALWRRDFTGASGLFSVVFKPVANEAFRNFVDSLELFHIGGSWGGYESLVLPIAPAASRSVTTWDAKGPALRFHVGLEDISDLIDDVAQGMKMLAGAPAKPKRAFT